MNKLTKYEQKLAHMTPNQLTREADRILAAANKRKAVDTVLKYVASKKKTI